MYINLNTNMSFEQFKNMNEKLDKYLNIVTEEDSEAMLKEYESYLQSTSKSNIIIIDPINSRLQNTF